MIRHIDKPRNPGTRCLGSAGRIPWFVALSRIASTDSKKCIAVYGNIWYDANEKMARKKIATTVYITEDQDQRLKELSKRTKVPVSVYIREGIDMALEKYKPLLPGQLTLDEKK